MMSVDASLRNRLKQCVKFSKEELKMAKQIITLIVDNPYDIEDAVMENVCSDWLNKECGVEVIDSETKEVEELKCN